MPVKIVNEGERLMFVANPLGQLFPLFAQGKFSETELYEFGDRNWADEILSPPNVGLWVWEYSPSGGSYDSWNGDYDDVGFDSGTWRPLTALEWYFVQQSENPWVPLIEAETHEERKEEMEIENKNNLDLSLERLFT